MLSGVRDAPWEDSGKAIQEGVQPPQGAWGRKGALNCRNLKVVRNGVNEGRSGGAESIWVLVWGLDFILEGMRSHRWF